MSSDPDGMSTAASYDCDPSDGSASKAHEPGYGCACEYSRGTHEPSEIKKTESS